MYILLPMMCWLNSEPSNDDRWYLCLYALLLIPKNYAWTKLPISHIEISINELLNTGLLYVFVVSLLTQASWYAWKGKRI